MPHSAAPVESLNVISAVCGGEILPMRSFAFATRLSPSSVRKTISRSLPSGLAEATEREGEESRRTSKLKNHHARRGRWILQRTIKRPDQGGTTPPHAGGGEKKNLQELSLNTARNPNETSKETKGECELA